MAHSLSASGRETTGDVYSFEDGYSQSAARRTSANRPRSGRPFDGSYAASLSKEAGSPERSPVSRHQHHLGFPSYLTLCFRKPRDPAICSIRSACRLSRCAVGRPIASQISRTGITFRCSNSGSSSDSHGSGARRRSCSFPAAGHNSGANRIGSSMLSQSCASAQIWSRSLRGRRYQIAGPSPARTDAHPWSPLGRRWHSWYR
jgi:hypothetical protein